MKLSFNEQGFTYLTMISEKKLTIKFKSTSCEDRTETVEDRLSQSNKLEEFRLSITRPRNQTVRLTKFTLSFHKLVHI